MSQRNKSISSLKSVKRGTAIAAAVMMLFLAAVGYPASAEDTDKEIKLEVAKAWAEAVRNRDGRAQFALYTASLQDDLTDVYEGLHWVTGTSSPWVESYAAELTSGGAAVTLFYAASTGPAGEYEVRLQFAEEGGAYKISGITNLELILGERPSRSGDVTSPASDHNG